MKYTFLLLLSVLTISVSSYSQNVGIGNTDPLTALDVKGDVRYRSVTITLPFTPTDLDITTNKASVFILISSGIGSLPGINGGVDGKIITLFNGTGFNSGISIVDENNAQASATAVNRIITGGSGYILLNQKASITLRYDGSLLRWTIVSKNGADDGSNFWSKNGSDIYSNQSGNVGIGNSSPLAKLDVLGDVRFNSQTLNLNGGLNNDVDLVASRSSVYSFSGGALGGCQISGFTGGVDGRLVTLFNNSTTAAVQLYNDYSSSADVNRILTGTGNSAIIYQNGSVSMRYDGGKQRWTILSSNYTDGLSLGGSGGGWGLTGNAGTTGANFIGTTDNKSFLIKTNNTTALNVSTDGNLGMGIAPGSTAKLWLSGSDNSIYMYGANGAYTGSVGTEAGNMLLQSEVDMVH
ncbi:MAG: hypothetical protein ABIX01_03785 [Chitinophagaceae bacterium]